MAFHPYLFFSGNCREAFTRYQQIFGGDLTLLRMADMPSDQGPVPADQADLIMHAALSLDGALLMASDDPTGDGGPTKGVAINYTCTEPAMAQRVFDALADGGTTTMPMQATFWSPSFGMCTDRFGISWMVSADSPDT